jgi:alpha-beta hydrolase superfamily lysophospholipase
MKMLSSFVRALLFWLGMLEWLAGWRGWWGLSWLGRRAPRPALVLLPALALLGLPAGRVRRALALTLAAPAALALHLAGTSLRNRALNPLDQLRPGRYADRAIERLDIPMADGYLPALHVVPSAGATAAVCVVHGSGCDKTSYAWRLVDTLLARGLAVLLIDLDGHGENPRAQSFPQIVDDVRVSVAWLRERYVRVGVLGISLGGCIAARAVADGVAVDGLAVLEAPPLLHYTQADVYREAAGLARPYLLDLFSDSTVYHVYRAWAYPPIRAAISTWDLIEALDLLGSLPRIGAPLLLMYGGSDAIVKPAQAELARAAMPAGATFHLMPWASHLTLILTPRALRIVGEWFEETLLAPSKVPAGSGGAGAAGHREKNLSA